MAHKRHQQRPTQQQLMFAGVSARRAETCNRATDSWFRRLPTHTAQAAQTFGAHPTQMAQTVGPHTNDTAQMAQVAQHKWHRHLASDSSDTAQLAQTVSSNANSTAQMAQTIAHTQVTQHRWHRQLAPTPEARHRWQRHLASDTSETASDGSESWFSPLPQTSYQALACPYR